MTTQHTCTIPVDEMRSVIEDTLLQAVAQRLADMHPNSSYPRDVSNSGSAQVELYHGDRKIRIEIITHVE